LRPNIAACKQPRDHLNHQIRQLTVDFAAEERLPAMYPLVEPPAPPDCPGERPSDRATVQHDEFAGFHSIPRHASGLE
jgi:hypothetical protein